MRAVILNSGMGTRLGSLTENTPKALTQLLRGETILSRQIDMLEKAGIQDFLITTGPFQDTLEDYVRTLNSASNFTYVRNPDYQSTNYIYSLFLAKDYLDGDIILLHGDLVFTQEVANQIAMFPESAMVISTTQEIPKDDFKAIIKEEKIRAVGVDYISDAVMAQPFYKLFKKDWTIWLEEIISFVNQANTSVYAENALNKVSHKMSLRPLDIKDEFCGEVDTIIDLKHIKKLLIKGE